ncbi:MAG: 4-hydroxy-tetrahydrodipicolinate reductase, partial [Chitinophagaceae bacterium]
MKIALLGYGKMGKTIEQVARQRGHEIALIIDQENRQDLNASNLQKIDVAIEFSTP